MEDKVAVNYEFKTEPYDHQREASSEQVIVTGLLSLWKWELANQKLLSITSVNCTLANM
jgi:hypothetical protein